MNVASILLILRYTLKRVFTDPHGRYTVCRERNTDNSRERKLVSILEKRERESVRDLIQSEGNSTLRVSFFLFFFFFSIFFVEIDR
ncbi:hypothetical protein MtrunA17_Chr2g0325401 [Medicago truncatula]|uniref:Transmembrane protein n=1 Tax=Medicago truncatula TaxID=3880 RepID=A0A396JEV9_MEDTR|nr:hypothetical protein MtrunA17_Chr2g0325401 [Medicago truncatula]